MKNKNKNYIYYLSIYLLPNHKYHQLLQNHIKERQHKLTLEVLSLKLDQNDYLEGHYFFFMIIDIIIIYNINIHSFIILYYFYIHIHYKKK